MNKALRASAFALILSLVFGAGLAAQRSGALTPQKPATPANVNLTVNVNVPGYTVYLNNVVQKGNVFSVKPGPYTLKVTVPGYADFVANIQMNGDQTVNVAMTPLNYGLTVSANVKGATVSLSNGLTGQAGQTFSLPAGSYQVTVSAPGFQDFVTTVSLNGPQTVNANLMPLSYGLTVTANVAGASVRLSNGLSGQAGQTFSLPAGSYQVTVSAPGYQDFATTVTLNGPQSVNATLNPLMYNLTVNANVKGAAVRLSNGLTGQAGQTFSLSGGAYQITVSAPGYQDFNTTVSLNGPQTVNAVLAPQTGVVIIEAPLTNGMQVYIDGVHQKGAKGNSITMTLTAGQHTVRYEFGNLQAEISLTVNPGQTLTVSPVFSIQVK